jgi:hypothetical protein
MLKATVNIPLLHCVQQYDENGNSEPYLWFAFFSADTTSTLPKPVSVVVPHVLDTRAQYPGNIGNNQDINIPVEVGSFTKNLEGGMRNTAMLGVLAVLFEEDDTSSEAISAGYAAFRDAVDREINNFVIRLVTGGGGLRPPTDDEKETIVRAIRSSVTDAISNKVGCWSGLWDNQDDFIGYSLALFIGDQLAEPIAPTAQALGLPPIDADAFKVVIHWTNPPTATLVKAGHNRYEFVRPTLRLQRVVADPLGDRIEKVVSVCVDKVKAFDEAVATLDRLRNQRNELRARLAHASEKDSASIVKEIEKLKENEIPRATRAVDLAAIALRDCHVLPSKVGNRLE